MWILFSLCLVVPTFAVSGKNDGLCLRKCCVNGNIKEAHRSKPNCNGCVDKEFSDLLEKIKDMSANASKIQTSVTEISSLMPTTTNTSEGQNSENRNLFRCIVLVLTRQRLKGGLDNITIAEIESDSSNSSKQLPCLISGTSINRTLQLSKGGSDNTTITDIESGSNNSSNQLFSFPGSDASISLSEKEIELIVQASSKFLQLNRSKVNRWKARVKDMINRKALKKRIMLAHIVNGIVSNLSVLTNNSEGLSPGNLNASVMIIDQVTVLLSNNTISLNETVVESIVQTVSNVLQSNNTDAWKALNDVNSTISTAIVYSVDVCGQILSLLNVSGHMTVNTENLVLETWSFTKSNSMIQTEFPHDSLWDENSRDGISISMESLNRSISPESQPTLNMWGVYYRTIHDQFPRKKHSNDVVNSRIISFSIGGLSTNETFNPPITITLRHWPTEEKGMSFQRMCAFWNFERSDWDSAGCSVTSTNKTHTICSCDHLTNFAILMSRNPVYDKTLSIVSIVGCSISVAALILTIVVYAITWKHAKSSQAAILLNLCVALVIAYIIFMAGADKVDSKVGCKVVAALLHYFLLVAFFIMLAEGVDMVLHIFFVFHVRRTRDTAMLIAAAWFLPLILVGVSLGVTRLEGYGHENACWLSVENGLIWAFAGPVLCIVAVNLVILIIILRLISKKKSILARNPKKRDEIRATIWNLSVMCPVLGLGWLFGVFSIFFDNVAFQYVFVIANSLHGLLIFIIYALFHNKKMNEKISTVYSKYIGHCRKIDPSVSSKTTLSQQQSTSSSSGNTQMTSAQEHYRSSTSNIQMHSTQEKSTITSVPEHSVLTTTEMTSAPGQSTIAAPAYDSLAITQVTSEP